MTPAPDRRPDWRWQAALALEGPAPAGRRSPDPWVRAARRFLRALRGDGPGADEAALAGVHPAAAAAYRVYADPAGALRAAVEARVLAGEAAAAVARKAGLAPAAAAFYEAVYFDARDRLGAADFVLAVAAAPPPGGRPEHRAWRALGYLGGPHVVDALVGGGPARPAGPDGAGAFLAAAARAAAAGGLAAAARDGQAAGLLAALARVGGGAGPGGGAGAAPGVLEAHVAAFLAEIPWAAGADGAAAVPAPLRAVDEAAAELRAEELLRVAAGAAPPDELAGLVLPPPRSARGPAGRGPSLLRDA